MSERVCVVIGKKVTENSSAPGLGRDGVQLARSLVRPGCLFTSASTPDTPPTHTYTNTHTSSPVRSGTLPRRRHKSWQWERDRERQREWEEAAQCHVYIDFCITSIKFTFSKWHILRLLWLAVKMIIPGSGIILSSVIFLKATLSTQSQSPSFCLLILIHHVDCFFTSTRWLYMHNAIIYRSHLIPYSFTNRLKVKAVVFIKTNVKCH